MAAKSESKHTRKKVEQFNHLLGVDLDWHNAARPKEPYGLIELYGGKFNYTEHGPEFYGNPYNFCHMAQDKGIDFTLLAFETDKENYAKLVAGLTEFEDRTCILNESNVDAVDFAEVLQMPKHGMVVADADGMFNFDLLLDVHKAYPNYSMMLNFNCTVLKWNKKRNYQHMLQYVSRLPKWTKYISPPKGQYQWTVMYLNKDPINPGMLEPFAPCNTPDGQTLLQRVALTIGQMKAGQTIFSPFFQQWKVAAAIGI